eukprot:1159277-Pelagomonas_calceolata.AAC.2
MQAHTHTHTYELQGNINEACGARQALHCGWNTGQSAKEYTHAQAHTCIAGLQLSHSTLNHI